MEQVILFTKRDAYNSRQAIELAKAVFGDSLTCFPGKVGEQFPEDVGWLKSKIMLSFLSPWIIPKYIIDCADIALNWHPASRNYPGIGCYNFALYEDSADYGATCHYMDEKVDTGAIVEERRFPIFPSDSVESLKLRTMVTMLSMFNDTICKIRQGEKPAVCGLSWNRRPFTRRELNELTVIDASMSVDEVKRRVRATVYPGYPGPYIEIAGEKFTYTSPDRAPLA